MKKMKKIKMDKKLLLNKFKLPKKSNGEKIKFNYVELPQMYDIDQNKLKEVTK